MGRPSKLGPRLTPHVCSNPSDIFPYLFIITLSTIKKKRFKLTINLFFNFLFKVKEMQRMTPKDPKMSSKQVEGKFKRRISLYASGTQTVGKIFAIDSIDRMRTEPIKRVPNVMMPNSNLPSSLSIYICLLAHVRAKNLEKNNFFNEAYTKLWCRNSNLV